jgi:hypothetical protein
VEDRDSFATVQEWPNCEVLAYLWEGLPLS